MATAIGKAMAYCYSCYIAKAIATDHILATTMIIMATSSIIMATGLQLWLQDYSYGYNCRLQLPIAYCYSYCYTSYGYSYHLAWIQQGYSYGYSSCSTAYDGYNYCREQREIASFRHDIFLPAKKFQKIDDLARVGEGKLHVHVQ